MSVLRWNDEKRVTHLVNSAWLSESAQSTIIVKFKTSERVISVLPAVVNSERYCTGTIKAVPSSILLPPWVMNPLNISRRMWVEKRPPCGCCFCSEIHVCLRVSVEVSCAVGGINSEGASWEVRELREGIPFLNTAVICFNLTGCLCRLSSYVPIIHSCNGHSS